MREIVRVCSYLIVALVVACSNVEDSDGSDGSREIAIADIYSMATARTTPIKEDLILRGYVSANDKRGEFQRCFILSDGTCGLKVEVDIAYIESVLPLGTMVTISCSGLYIGREGSSVTLGVKPTDIYCVDRIPEDRLFKYITISDSGCTMPTPAVVSISDIDEGDILRYVAVENLMLVDEERRLTWCDKDAEGNYILSLRHFTDGENTIAIATAPTATYCGEEVLWDSVTCVGVVDIYDGEVALRLSDYQISSDSKEL